MKRMIPHPFLTLGLIGIWVLLNSPSLGHIILGAVVGLVAGWAFSAVEPEPLRLRRPMAMVKLFGIVGLDIIRSNIAVASLILSRGNHGSRVSAFIEIPLRLRDPMPLAVLSMIVTATPGTAWLEYDEESGVLLLHVFDFRESDDWKETIGNRYESLLMEIFP